MDLQQVRERSGAFSPILQDAKAKRSDIAWYPYGSMHNLNHFENYFAGEGRGLFSGIDKGLRVADIGAADGDISFFLSSLGANVTIIDNKSTNFNDCAGINSMKEMLNSSVDFIELDLDFAPFIPGQYDLAIFCGILYHLRNPMLVLMALANACERMVISTAVFSKLRNGQNVESEELAVLVPTRAVNNDPTNYWSFTPIALRTLLKRSGWTVLDDFRTGNVGDSHTFGSGDERMFCYCQRVPHWKHLRAHHDF